MSQSKRPLTANSVIQRLQIEKANSDEGLTMCGGIFLASNCYIILLVMAGIFIVAGAILTAISWRPREFGEEMERFLKRQVTRNYLNNSFCWKGRNERPRSIGSE